MLAESRYAVLLHDERVGTLHQRGDHTRFVSDEDYLRDPHRAVLGLRLEEDLTGRHSAALRLPAWFSNLLPEGVLRQWIADDRGVSADREMELLAQVGHDLPGAVRVLPCDDESEGHLDGARVQRADLQWRHAPEELVSHLPRPATADPRSRLRPCVYQCLHGRERDPGHEVRRFPQLRRCHCSGLQSVGTTRTPAWPTPLRNSWNASARHGPKPRPSSPKPHICASVYRPVSKSAPAPCSTDGEGLAMCGDATSQRPTTPASSSRPAQDQIIQGNPLNLVK